MCCDDYKDMPNSRHSLHGSSYFFIIVIIKLWDRDETGTVPQEHWELLPEKARDYNGQYVIISERSQEMADISEGKIRSFGYIWNSAVEKVHSRSPF